MYYFDGKNILAENYTYNNPIQMTSQNFDENFEDINSSDMNQKYQNYTQDFNQSTLNKNYDQSYGINFKNFILSSENPEYMIENQSNNNQEHSSNQDNFKDDLVREISENIKINYQNPILESTQKLVKEPNLIPENLILNIKDTFYKKRGYIENKPETLFEFVMEYRSFLKRGLKVPNKIAPILDFLDEDIYNSLRLFHQAYVQSYNNTYNSFTKKSTMSIRGISIDKFKSKFSEDTLKRLYPHLKPDEELMKTKSEKNGPVTIDKMIEWLVTLYYKKYNEYTNDEVKLYDFWAGFSNEEKELNGLKWPLGDKNFENYLTQFFSNEKIIKRLSKSFQNLCGYECYHPRPLHDYWVKQMSKEEKYKKGLSKYDSDTMFKILEENYFIRKEEDRKNNENVKNKKIDTIHYQKSKVIRDKENLQNLMKKFVILARPKDKWKTGREMINLRRQFKYDNILKKMIKLEFQSNKVFKYPEEYALYDEDQMRKVIFKNSLEKKIKKNENEDHIREMIHRTKYEDDNIIKKEESKLKQIYKEDKSLEKYLKRMCIKYFRLTNIRLENGSTSFTVNKFMTDMYNYMIRNHTNSTKRRFPKINNYGRKKSRFSNYPKGLKFYFFMLYRRLAVSENGQKFIFAHLDNMPFWAPAISNKCKIHKNSCPIYCTYNSHNKIISTQKSKNFNLLYNLEDKKLTEEERLNLWKRKDEDLMKKKSKIFLCLSDAEHCTFEPKLIHNEENYVNNSTEHVINKRISNKVWVNKMGDNFSERFPLVYKVGIYKQARILFQSGKFNDTLSLLATAFNLDAIKAKYDPKFEATYKKKIAKEREKESGNVGNSNNDTMNIMNMISRDEKKKEVEPDNFDNPKNYQICYEIFSMIKNIEEYKEDRKKTVKKLKEELNIIKDAKKNSTIFKGKAEIIIDDINNKQKLFDTNNQNLMLSTNMNTVKSQSCKVVQNDHSNHKINFIKDKYFKFFKTIMCPLR